jgi:hypothetical protein
LAVATVCWTIANGRLQSDLTSGVIPGQVASVDPISLAKTIYSEILDDFHLYRICYHDRQLLGPGYSGCKVNRKGQSTFLLHGGNCVTWLWVCCTVLKARRHWACNAKLSAFAFRLVQTTSFNPTTRLVQPDSLNLARSTRLVQLRPRLCYLQNFMVAVDRRSSMVT